MLAIITVMDYNSIGSHDFAENMDASYTHSSLSYFSFFLCFALIFVVLYIAFVYITRVFLDRYILLCSPISFKLLIISSLLPKTSSGSHFGTTLSVIHFSSPLSPPSSSIASLLSSIQAKVPSGKFSLTLSSSSTLYHSFMVYLVLYYVHLSILSAYQHYLSMPLSYIDEVFLFCSSQYLDGRSL